MKNAPQTHQTNRKRPMILLCRRNLIHLEGPHMVGSICCSSFISGVGEALLGLSLVNSWCPGVWTTKYKVRSRTLYSTICTSQSRTIHSLATKRVPRRRRGLQGLSSKPGSDGADNVGHTTFVQERRWRIPPKERMSWRTNSLRDRTSSMASS